MEIDIHRECEDNLALLRERQNYPLEGKIYLTKRRIKEWYEHWNGQVYVSFSGGKDSTVLLHLVRSMYPDVEAVFLNTGLEYPEIIQHVKTIENVTWIKPKLTYRQVIEKYGYPLISKENAEKIDQIRNAKSQKTINTRLHGDKKGNGKLPKKWHFLIKAPFKISSKCCYFLKKSPVKKFEKKSGKKPFVGMMVGDSALRKTNYLRRGCNSFSTSRPMSNPMSFWKEQDVWDYLKKYNVPYSKIYDMGYDRTGCMWCMFGVHLEKGKNRFQKMKKTHPLLWNACINKMGLSKVLDYIDVPYE